MKNTFIICTLALTLTNLAHARKLECRTLLDANARSALVKKVVLTDVGSSQQVAKYKAISKNGQFEVTANVNLVKATGHHDLSLKISDLVSGHVAQTKVKNTRGELRMLYGATELKTSVIIECSVLSAANEAVSQN